MTGITYRPAIFADLGASFVDNFGNVDVVPVIDGQQKTAVRGILRQFREADLADPFGQSVEGVTHKLSLDASASSLDGMQSDRDSVIINEVAYAIRSFEDDGRAMLRLLLTGEI